MGSFEILPHTADLRLKVTGKTLKDLFEQAVFGLSDILKSGECSTFNVEHKATSTSYKAVTYHEAKIIRNKKGELETIILFDI